VIKVDVIRRCSVCLKAYGLADHKRNGFGLGFAYCLGGRGATFGPVQHLVRLCGAKHKRTYVVSQIMLRLMFLTSLLDFPFLLHNIIRPA
jgi:hypothetical protein